MKYLFYGILIAIISCTPKKTTTKPRDLAASDSSTCSVDTKKNVKIPDLSLSLTGYEIVGEKLKIADVSIGKLEYSSGDQFWLDITPRESEASPQYIPDYYEFKVCRIKNQDNTRSISSSQSGSTACLDDMDQCRIAEDPRCISLENVFNDQYSPSAEKSCICGKTASNLESFPYRSYITGPLSIFVAGCVEKARSKENSNGEKKECGEFFKTVENQLPASTENKDLQEKLTRLKAIDVAIRKEITRLSQKSISFIKELKASYPDVSSYPKDARDRWKGIVDVATNLKNAPNELGTVFSSLWEDWTDQIKKAKQEEDQKTLSLTQESGCNTSDKTVAEDSSQSAASSNSGSNPAKPSSVTTGKADTEGEKTDSTSDYFANADLPEASGAYDPNDPNAAVFGNEDHSKDGPNWKSQVGYLFLGIVGLYVAYGSIGGLAGSAKEGLKSVYSKEFRDKKKGLKGLLNNAEGGKIFLGETLGSNQTFQEVLKNQGYEVEFHSANVESGKIEMKMYQTKTVDGKPEKKPMKQEDIQKFLSAEDSPLRGSDQGKFHVDNDRLIFKGTEVSDFKTKHLIDVSPSLKNKVSDLKKFTLMKGVMGVALAAGVGLLIYQAIEGSGLAGDTMGQNAGETIVQNYLEEIKKTEENIIKFVDERKTLQVQVGKINDQLGEQK